MNREQKIDRLQSLLSRVQGRAKEPRAPRAGSLALAAAPSVAITMPTSEAFGVEETRPFAGVLEKRPVAAEADDVLLKTGEANLDLDDVGFGGLEIVDESEAELDVFGEEPASASRRVLELEVDVDGTPDAPRVTPPPESGPQVSSKQPSLEVDDGPIVPRHLEHPSIEMLGQTVDLPGSEKEAGKLELDRKPIEPLVRDRPTGEMEAVIPGSFAPGVYSPSESKTADPFLGEPPTQDWDLPDEFVSPSVVSDAEPSTKKREALVAEEAPRVEEAKKAPVITEDEPFAEELVAQPTPMVEEAQVAPEDVEAVTRKPRQLEEEMRAAAERHDRQEAVQPMMIEIAGTVVSAPALSTSQVAAFRGAIEAAKPKTFLEVLDRSLKLEG
jgi:hypothetical protein